MAQNRFDYKSNYSKLLTVQVYHDFYSDTLCKELVFIPDLESSRLLRNYSLLFKKLNNGFVIIMNHDKKFNSPVFSGEITLNFILKFKDPYFLIKTDIPYSNNQQINLKNDSGETEKLHKNNFVDFTDMEETTENGIIGLITLTTNKNDEYFGKEGEYEVLPEQNYSINFTSRKIKFRYNFYSTNEVLDFEKYYITNEQLSFKLAKFNKRTLENGMEVFTMELEEQTHIRDVYSTKLFLKKDDEFNKSFSKFLPTPSLKNINYDLISQIYYGDVFIKID